MNINDFMETKIPEIKNIISNLRDEFSSHQFIQKFSKQFEPEYIDMLMEYRGFGAFRAVHSQIATYLSKNMDKLDIEKIEPKKESINIFGDTDIIQWWKK
ncbi:hypothetical protein [Coprobacter sp.]|jgi:hypothetical protein|uniref:hypothetical protein n=1 Tax=Coprobacter sp. TaxID=1941478 RepID=UPI0025F36AE2|nr:hypothetical protein [uncultured Coprobacter sp.]